MRKRLLLMGPSDEENKNLLYLLENNKNLRIRPSIMYYDKTILFPSTYLRSPWMKKHLIAMQQNANYVLMLASCHSKRGIYSPNFAKAFRVPSIGVILYDDTQSKNRVSDCKMELINAGVNEIVELNLKNSVECNRFLQKIRLDKEGSS